MKFTNIVTASLISASVTQAAVIPQSNEDLAVRADSSDPISDLLGGLLGGGSGAPAPAQLQLQLQLLLALLFLNKLKPLVVLLLLLVNKVLLLHLIQFPKSLVLSQTF